LKRLDEVSRGPIWENAHRLIVAAELVRKDATHPELRRQVFYQMTRLTRDKGALQHDDRLDALSMAVGYWVEAGGPK
jgi:hypothetical protein